MWEKKSLVQKRSGVVDQRHQRVIGSVAVRFNTIVVFSRAQRVLIQKKWFNIFNLLTVKMLNNPELWVSNEKRFHHGPAVLPCVPSMCRNIHHRKRLCFPAGPPSAALDHTYTVNTVVQLDYSIPSEKLQAAALTFSISSWGQTFFQQTGKWMEKVSGFPHVTSQMFSIQVITL